MIIYRLSNDYRTNDVIAFRNEEDNHFIKRVVAVAGDVVVIEDGVLYVNNSAQIDNVYFETHPAVSGISYPMIVPEGSVFVLGDNRENSTDSRTFGCVEVSKIEGKVIFFIRTRVV